MVIFIARTSVLLDSMVKPSVIAGVAFYFEMTLVNICFHEVVIKPSKSKAQ